MAATRTKPEPKGAATVDNEAELERAAAELDRLLDDPTSSGDDISHARGALEHAQAQRARAERLDAEAAEAARVARIDEIAASIRDGHLHEQAAEALALRSEALTILQKVHALVQKHSDEVRAVHFELVLLGKQGPLPETITANRPSGMSGNVQIDGVRWAHGRDFASRVVAELAAEVVGSRMALERANERRTVNTTDLLRRPLEAGARAEEQA